MMDLKNKLKGIPPIYYINLEHRTDRREHMEIQFDYWGIQNYNRINASKFLPSNYDKWKKFIFEEEIVECVSLMSCATNQIKTIIDWYDCNISESCVIMEDDISIYNAKFWNFNWSHFEKNLPENWECIQLYFCNPNFIPMFLHQRLKHSGSTACYMVNRSYAKKLKKIMYIDGRYKLRLYDNSYEKKYFPALADGNLFDIGVSYSIPLFSLNILLDSDNEINNYKMNPIDIKSTKLIDNWWKNEHRKFPLIDFFTYGKPNDWEMTKNVKLEEIKKKLNYN
jgi:hypothetical protein